MEITKDIELIPERLIENIEFLNDYFKRHNVQWTFVAKLFHEYSVDFMKELIKIVPVESIALYNLNQLEAIKNFKPSLETWFINYEGIEIGAPFIDVNLTHNPTNIDNSTCLMVTLEEDRYGVSGEEVEELIRSNQIIKTGAYFDCSRPPEIELLKKWSTYDFQENTLKTMGTSSAFSMIETIKAYGGNHFRIGETAFFGKEINTQQNIKGLRQDVFASRKKINYHIIENKISHENN